jgi:hypothetical protein
MLSCGESGSSAAVSGPVALSVPQTRRATFGSTVAARHAGNAAATATATSTATDAPINPAVGDDDTPYNIARLTRLNASATGIPTATAAMPIDVASRITN